MEENKDGRLIALLIFGTLVGFALWLLLICLKIAGVVTMSWVPVLSGLVWLTWGVYCFGGLALAVVKMITELKRWNRRRKADARIIRQAKAAGVWNTKAGGRALELYAKECGVKKFPGETDAHLRQRIKEAAEKQCRSK